MYGIPSKGAMHRGKRVIIYKIGLGLEETGDFCLNIWLLPTLSLLAGVQCDSKKCHDRLVEKRKFGRRWLRKKGGALASFAPCQLTSRDKNVAPVAPWPGFFARSS